MNPVKKIPLTLAALLYFGSQTFAQQVSNVCSNSLSINGNNYQYSIGETVLVSAESNPTLIITQGFLQPLTPSQFSSESVNDNGLTNAGSAPDLFQIYPVPATNKLYIASVLIASCDINYRIFDVAGKMVYNKTNVMPAGPMHFSIDLEDYAEGNYYLSIIQNYGDGITTSNSYKIQKVKR